MDNINSIVAHNLKELREKRKLSLDAVAKLTGVSKSMLGQIERGDVNPTISTVWKIANGLKLSFTELMSRPESDYEMIDTKQLEPLLEDDGKFRNFPVIPFDSTRRFEIYYLEIDARGILESEAHPAGTQEFITNYSGDITILVNTEEFTIKEGVTFRFMADRPHSYKNSGNEMCRLNMVIYYPQ